MSLRKFRQPLRDAASGFPGAGQGPPPAGARSRPGAQPKSVTVTSAHPPDALRRRWAYARRPRHGRLNAAAALSYDSCVVQQTIQHVDQLDESATVQPGDNRSADDGPYVSCRSCGADNVSNGSCESIWVNSRCTRSHLSVAGDAAAGAQVGRRREPPARRKPAQMRAFILAQDALVEHGHVPFSAAGSGCGRWTPHELSLCSTTLAAHRRAAGGAHGDRSPQGW